MPRSFLIKKHFGCPPKKRHLLVDVVEEDDCNPIVVKRQPEDLSRTNATTGVEQPSSGKLNAPTAAVALIARTSEQPKPSLLEPVNLNAVPVGAVWSHHHHHHYQHHHHKTVIPPYLPFNFTTLYPSFPQADYYGSSATGGARLVPPLYPASPPQRTATLPAESYVVKREASSPLKKPEPLAPLPLDSSNNSVLNGSLSPGSVSSSGSVSGVSTAGSASPPSSNCSFLYQLWSGNGSDAEKSQRESDRESPVDAGLDREASGKKRREAPRYQCPDCNKSYSTYSGLTKHRQFHCVTQATKSFSCKYCDKVYVSLGALKMHIRTHTLPCKCKLCGKAFSRPWLLQGHIRTHTGEKPFACPHCNRAFADRSNLRAHLQTHSDVKKYSCKNCSKTFSRMSLLVKHEDGGCAGPQIINCTA